MYPQTTFAHRLGLAALCAVSLASQAALAGISTQPVSAAVRQGVDLGAVDRNQLIQLTLHVAMPNEAAFAQAVDKLYDPQSPSYRHWMSDSDLARYAPSAASVASVRAELASHGLIITDANGSGSIITDSTGTGSIITDSTGSGSIITDSTGTGKIITDSTGTGKIITDAAGTSPIITDATGVLHVTGTAAQVEEAFQTSLHNILIKGKVLRAHVTEARLTGSAGALVAAVSGLDQRPVHTLLSHAGPPSLPVQMRGTPLSKVEASGGLASLITDQCLYPPATVTYTTPGAALPVGTFSGQVYNPVDSAGNSLVCAFTASQLQAHYGLPAAYKKGLDGRGQTIVLLEAYGYPTMLSDANAFSTMMGLPPLGAGNFEVIYPQGKPNPSLGVLEGWDTEIALDIQWAHSMAPGAKIVVVVSYGQDSEDFQQAMSYIIDHHVGTVVSDSWEEDLDLLSGPAENESYNTILRKAAAKGISFQFSSGDSGDSGVGVPLGAPNVPSNSPYATAVGGTAVINVPGTDHFQELGWGDTFTYLALGGVFDPPQPIGLYAGSSGGESTYYAKPFWQFRLPGAGRQVPDISALGDPYTGVAIVVTELGVPTVLPGIGGTSLSSPIVTAILAIATQKAGRPLGLVGPILPYLPKSALLDVVPPGGANNVSGSITDSAGTTSYSAADLLQPYLFSTVGFLACDYPLGPDSALDIAFGVDSSLTVTAGWDNVTGYGVPNGLQFIEAISAGY